MEIHAARRSCFPTRWGRRTNCGSLRWRRSAPCSGSVRYDTRGHGASDVPAGSYAIDALGLDAIAILDAAGVERAHVCGLSLGGLTAMWLGVHAPHRIRSLVLSSTAARIGSASMWDERIAQVRTAGVESLADAAMGRWFTAGYRAGHPEVVSVYHRMLGATPADGYAGCCAAIRDADLREAIKSIAAPTLVIAGREDPVTPPADGESDAQQHSWRSPRGPRCGSHRQRRAGARVQRPGVVVHQSAAEARAWMTANAGKPA